MRSLEKQGFSRVRTLSKTIKLRKATGGVRLLPGMVTRGTRAVSVRKNTYDPKNRTFTFVLASETPCRTWRLDRYWDFVEVDEVLSMAGLVIPPDFAEKGLPLVDSHDTSSVRNALGRITAMRVEGTELVCDAFLSDKPGMEGVARDIETGVLTDFSVGFDILEETIAVDRKGDVPLVTVTKWTVREGSSVLTPADLTATMRGARSKRGAPSKRNGTRSMTKAELEALATGFRSATEAMSTASAALLTGLASLAEVDDADEVDDLEAEAEAAAQEARAAVLARRGVKETKDPVVEEKPAERSAQEKANIAGLRLACGRRGLAAEFKLLEDGNASIEKMQDLLLSGVRTSKVEQDQSQTPGAGGKERGKLVTAAESKKSGRSAVAK